MKQIPGRFIDPLSDFGFKHLFGNETNKVILIDFLNQLFKGQKEISDVRYGPTEHAGDTSDIKKAIFDLLCTGKNGEQFVIEMQRGEQLNFKDRAVFYTSRLISEQLPKGKSNWETGLKEVYLIAILEFNFKDSRQGQYLHNVALADIDTGEHFYNKLGYKFLELPNFVKTEAELETDLDRWFYLLKQMSRLDKIPAALNNPVFQKIFEIAEISNLTKEEKKMYDSSLQAKWDYENVLAFAKQKAEKIGYESGHQRGVEEGFREGVSKGIEKGIEQGVERGIQKGIEQGIEQGIQQGIQQGIERGIARGVDQGIERGEHNKALSIALEMKKENTPFLQIAKLTKLSIAEIEIL